MHRFFSKLTVAIVSGLLALSLAGGALAQDKKKDERKTKETVAMSQQVYEKLSEIQEMVEAKDYASAQRLIDDL